MCAFLVHVWCTLGFPVHVLQALRVVHNTCTERNPYPVTTCTGNSQHARDMHRETFGASKTCTVKSSGCLGNALACTCAHTNTHTLMHSDALVWSRMQSYKHADMHKLVCIRMQVYVLACTRMHFAGVRMHTNMHTCMHSHALVHTRMHSYTLACARMHLCALPCTPTCTHA